MNKKTIYNKQINLMKILKKNQYNRKIKENKKNNNTKKKKKKMQIKNFEKEQEINKIIKQTYNNEKLIINFLSSN